MLDKLTHSSNGDFTIESYNGESDHREYMGYLREQHGLPFWVRTKEIMQEWTDGVIISEGFASCFPVIAINPEGKCQMVHFSRDPWRLTDSDEFQQKIREWKSNSCEITLMRAMRSASGGIDSQLKREFGEKYNEIEFGIDSRFGIVIDVKKRIVLVQLTDAKELRRYHI